MIESSGKDHGSMSTLSRETTSLMVQNVFLSYLICFSVMNSKIARNAGTRVRILKIDMGPMQYFRTSSAYKSCQKSPNFKKRTQKWLRIMNLILSKYFTAISIFLQVNLCQKLFFFQNMERTCCVQKLIWMLETISVHNMFSPVLSLKFSCIELQFNEQSVIILWVSWCKNKRFWQRFTFKRNSSEQCSQTCFLTFS